ncbi:MAG: DnaA regulatory inactivator Hda [Methylibium sp.]|uniref:DnaA regulatory inactivator Hda n=1 Tax=Methylibium sp. TaxID=2067992 RepID=UPI00180FBA76|nr:DnaA regulatory inactivator Hda [Methylibium sp.]MBA3598451.1 DnaA regulatory inactivator Hda [Methylibium sp.]
MKQLPLGLRPGPQQRFDSFAVGANAAALSALRGTAAGAAPIYLWGGAGAGKTHLLRALADEAVAECRPAGVFDRSTPPPWVCNEDTRLILLDDCEAFDSAQQHAAFTLFVEAQALGASVVAAGRLPPVDLPVREDLRTRLGWGLVFQLQPLNEVQARDTLKREAGRRGIVLTEEVAAYLLTRFARDLGSLMRLLDALDEFALVHQRPVTVPLVRQMLAERDEEKRHGASA